MTSEDPDVTLRALVDIICAQTAMLAEHSKKRLLELDESRIVRNYTELMLAYVKERNKTEDAELDGLSVDELLAKFQASVGKK